LDTRIVAGRRNDPRQLAGPHALHDVSSAQRSATWMPALLRLSDYQQAALRNAA
jgi:hypothetical protein